MAKNNNGYLVLGIVAIVVIVALALLLRPVPRETTSLGRAADEISEGVRDAADELNPREKTTGEKIGGAVEDLGDDIKDAARN